MEGESLELKTLIEELNTKHESATSTRQKQDIEALFGIVHLVRFLMQPDESGALPRTDFELAVRERATRLDASMIRFEQAFESHPIEELDQRLRLAIAAATK